MPEDQEDPETEITDLLESGVDGFPPSLDTIKHGGRVVSRPRDWWAFTIKAEEMDTAESADSADPPAGFSHFDMTIIRPDPLLLARLKHGQHIRRRDEWEFVFEGDPALVRRQRAIMMLTISAFARDESDETRRELRRWIALHYLARSSPVLTRCARGDAPEVVPVRRLDKLTRDVAASSLARDLGIKDRDFVSGTLDLFAAFLEKINELPEESLSRLVVDRALGIEPDDQDDAEYLALPDLTAEECAEMDRLKDLAIRRELNPDGQARLLPLLKRHTAHVKARLGIGKAQ